MPLVPENVQNYPRPPLLEPAGVHVKAVLGGVTLFDTDEAWRVCETHHAPTYYVPPHAIRDGALTPARGRSLCEWKGAAHYFDVVGGLVVAPRAAWAYANPTRAFEPIRDFVSFYPGAMEGCFVEGERVTPQPGDFYGGWVTSNLSGIVKGDAATRHW